jgi:flagellar biosynthesis chaperone FliJ
MFEEIVTHSTSLGKILDELGNGMPKLLKLMEEKPTYSHQVAEEIKKKIAQGVTEKDNLNKAISKVEAKLVQKFLNKSMFQKVEAKREETRKEFDKLRAKAKELTTYIDIIHKESKELK